MPVDQPRHESVSLWDHKPWWCQPWSILLTGVAVVALSWPWLGLWWLTALVAAAVLMWWGLFLALVPRAWRAAVEAGESEASAANPAGRRQEGH